mgnify:CR=1 FL=1
MKNKAAEKGIITALNDKLFKEKVGEKYLSHIYEVIKSKTLIVKVDPQYFRPTEVDLLIGDNTKAKTKLGWNPKYTLEMLVREMVKSDLEIFKKEKYFKRYIRNNWRHIKDTSKK